MSLICRRCGAPMSESAVKCTCCGGLASEVAVDRSAMYARRQTAPATPRNTSGTAPRVNPTPAANPAPRTNPAPAVNFASGANNASAANSMPFTSAAPAASAKYRCDSLFASADWSSAWSARRMGGYKLGIILTDTTAAGDSTELMRSIADYAASKIGAGVEYHLLDLKDQCVIPALSQNIGGMVSLLGCVYDVAVPDYLMIVGDATVIPQANWHNVCDDGDETVPSDLPYVSLDTTSPFEGVIYDFDNITQVGRIPSKAENNFAEAVRYLDNTARFRGHNAARAFSYSARVWEKTSQVEFAHLKPAFITSPIYTSSYAYASGGTLLQLGKLSGEYDLLCFNLHGSDETHTWYGQDGSFYPDAFEKELLPQNDGYVLCTEACYGARPLSSASIVVNALMNGCVAYVGSSRIAYGMSNGSMSCADVVANRFTQCLVKGMTVGASFLGALSALTSTDSMDEEEIKTLAEFALYGDPSVTLINSVFKKEASRGSAKKNAVKKDSSRAIRLVDCESGRSAKGGDAIVSFTPEEKMRIESVVSKINESKGIFALEGTGSGGVKPKVYKVLGREEYRAVYDQRAGKVRSITKMHLDGEGNVKKVYNSK